MLAGELGVSARSAGKELGGACCVNPSRKRKLPGMGRKEGCCVRVTLDGRTVNQIDTYKEMNIDFRVSADFAGVSGNEVGK